MADAIAIARGNIEAFNAGDWQRYRAILASDSVYEEPATQRRLQGVDAGVAAAQGWKQAFPDARGTITGSLASGDRAVLEITWEGTQTGDLVGPLGTITATGRRVVVKAVQVVEVSGDQIKETRHYFDLMGMLQQLGTIPAATAS